MGLQVKFDYEEQQNDSNSKLDPGWQIYGKKTIDFRHKMVI